MIIIINKISITIHYCTITGKMHIFTITCQLGCGNGRYRAVASNVMTVNQLYISLLNYSWLSLLSSASVWQKSGRLYNELRNESSLELKLLLGIRMRIFASR